MPFESGSGRAAFAADSVAPQAGLRLLSPVDKPWSGRRASAERGPSFFLGSDPSPNEIEALAGDDTEIVRLEGATVMPGLIDSHVHSTGAAVYEFDHEIPEMESIADVLAYIESRAAVLEEGEWIISEEE